MSKNKKKAEDITPLMVYGSEKNITASEIRASSTSVRRNAASSLEKTDRFTNIDKGLIPFKHSNYINNLSTLDVKDAVVLCQKAYYNVAIFRNTIDLMTEFSCSKIYLTGGSQKSKEFFDAYFKKINLISFQDQFFREYYRSGNVFVYKFDANISDDQLAKMTQTFGLNKTNLSVASVKLPVRYTILNPADIYAGGSINFNNRRFYKILSDYELERLRTPKTDEDAQVLNSLDEETKKKIQSKSNGTVFIALDSEKVNCVFYKKQDYEPLAIPMGFPVLDDINWKLEMKKMDMAVTRTTQQAILLITMGTEPDKGGINQKNLQSMQQLFENQSVGRVLIADYTTKAQFVIPDIAALIGPQKYEVVDRDIQIGLNNILIGEEKFANQSIKIQVFIERLKQAREAFINEFLIPEIRRISKDLGFKNFPTPQFEDIDLKDDLQYARVYTRLVELGVLTPEEGFQAIQNGRLPNQEESESAQEKFKSLKEKGFYQPLIGGPKLEAGRPSGTTGIPQSTKNVKPIGTSKAFSISKIKENILASQDLDEQVKSYLRKKLNVKKLSNSQKDLSEKVTEIIIANEKPNDWKLKISEYLDNPIDKNFQQINEIQEICLEHQVNSYLGSLLYHSAKV